MTFRDRVSFSAGNLRRMKLRTSLTSGGIMIAIAAFVAMLSFGAGNEAYVAKQFDDLGLLTTIQVFPKTGTASQDSSPPLDKEAIERFAAIPGVRLVYPYEAFAVTFRMGDSTIETKAQGLPVPASQTKLFSHLEAGHGFVADSSSGVILSHDLIEKCGVTNPDSAIGKRVIISVKVSRLDSALSHLISDKGVSLLDRAKRHPADSLLKREYLKKTFRAELAEIFRRLTSGFINARATVSETLTVSGVRPRRQMGGLKIEPAIIPAPVATRFSASGFNGNPADLFMALSNGTLFQGSGQDNGKNYPQVTVDFDPKTPYRSVRDSIEACGYRTFSFAARFEEIQKTFVYIDLALALIGLIALSTASLGIINTMVMSTSERRREIGILKSLGADQNDIRVLFLFESGIIGFLGTTAGIIFGWLIARGASAITQAYMQSHGFQRMELFAMPPWIVMIALGVGVSVSVAAGLYPAVRASRVDPVEALRSE
jgi:ABC-type antimicrobial peptide transport system permease subunit